MHSLSAVNDVLARAGIFQGLPASAVTTVVARLPQVSFIRGQVVFTEGDKGDDLYIITRGKVKIGRKTDDGRECVIALLGPADMFGEMAIFDPGPRTSTVTALTSMDAVVMDRAVLRDWITEQPMVAEQLLRVLARRLRRTNSTLSDLIFTDVPARVAKQLLYLAQQFGVPDGDSIRVEHNLTQEELAHLVGAARETVNKALSDFARRGWIRRQGKTVFVDNPERLAYRAR